MVSLSKRNSTARPCLANVVRTTSPLGSTTTNSSGEVIELTIDFREFFRRIDPMRTSSARILFCPGGPAMHTRRVLTTLLFLGLLLAAPALARAQSATPAASPAAGAVQTVATRLTKPRGFPWGPDGTLYVALAGAGGNTPATEQAPVSAILGPFMGGPSGAVVSIDASGCPVA